MLKYDEQNGYTTWGMRSANMMVVSTCIALAIGLVSVFALPGGVSADKATAKNLSFHLPMSAKPNAPDSWTLD